MGLVIRYCRQERDPYLEHVSVSVETKYCPLGNQKEPMIIILSNGLLEKWYIIEAAELVFVIERPAAATSKLFMGRSTFFGVLTYNLFIDV